MHNQCVRTGVCNEMRACARTLTHPCGFMCGTVLMAWRWPVPSCSPLAAGSSVWTGGGSHGGAVAEGKLQGELLLYAIRHYHMTDCSHGLACVFFPCPAHWSVPLLYLYCFSVYAALSLTICSPTIVTRPPLQSFPVRCHLTGFIGWL